VKRGIKRTVAYLPSAICNLLGVHVNLSALASRKANLAAAAARFCSLHCAKMRRRGSISAALVSRG